MLDFPKFLEYFCHCRPKSDSKGPCNEFVSYLQQLAKVNPTEFKVYMTDFFLFARSDLCDIVISTRKVLFQNRFFPLRFSRLKT